MFERNDDVLYICYDNEGYMNTGVQRSSATPPAARTATTPALGPEPGNVFGTGKSVPKIAIAHGIPYVATATVADLHDLERKVVKAMGDSRRALHPDPRAVSARLGLGVARHHSPRAARRRMRTVPGLRGRERRRDRRAARSAARCRSQEYLKPQKRFAHLFGSARGRARIARLQAIADRNIAEFGLLDGDGDIDGTPVCHHARRRNRASPTTPARGAPSARSMSTGCRRAITPVRPAKTSRAGCYHAESGDYEAAWRVLTQDNPLPAVMGRVCYHPCESACNRAQARRGRRHQLGRALPRRRGASSAAGASRRPTTESGKRVLVVGAGPSGLSAAYHLRGSATP